MVCKIIFCSEFPDIPDKAGRKLKKRRRRRTQEIAKRYAFHANATRKKIDVLPMCTSASLAESKTMSL